MAFSVSKKHMDVTLGAYSKAVQYLEMGDSVIPVDKEERVRQRKRERRRKSETEKENGGKKRKRDKQ